VEKGETCISRNVPLRTNPPTSSLQIVLISPGGYPVVQTSHVRPNRAIFESDLPTQGSHFPQICEIPRKSLGYHGKHCPRGLFSSWWSFAIPDPATLVAPYVRKPIRLNSEANRHMCNNGSEDDDDDQSKPGPLPPLAYSKRPHGDPLSPPEEMQTTIFRLKLRCTQYNPYRFRPTSA